MIIGIMLLVAGGALWLSAQSIQRRSRHMEDDARFNGITASDMSRDESQSDSDDDDRLALADVQALTTYARVLKAAAVICVAAAMLITIVISF